MTVGDSPQVAACEDLLHTLDSVPSYVTVPRIDPVKWRDLLRSVWDAKPGLVTAKLTFNTLYSQFQEMKQLRSEVDAGVARSLASWDQQLENYRGRLSVYRDIVFDTAETYPDPLVELDKRYAKPVFDGNYAGIVGDPDAIIEWPGFRLPSPPVADAMTSAILYNQLTEAIVVSDQRLATKYGFLASCVALPLVVVNPSCYVALGIHFSSHLVKAKEDAQKLGADIEKSVDDAVEAVKQAAKDLATGIQRGLNAAAEGISFGVKAVGVVLGATFLYFIYQKATEDSHG